MTTTVIEPSAWTSEGPLVRSKPASTLSIGDIVTNLGVVDAVTMIGVFVVATIRGTVWSLATGKGGIASLDVIWHESQTVTVDQP